MLKGLILKKQADLFTVELENGVVQDVVARKNLKKEGLFVGDKVTIDDDNAICRLEKRKNVLVRPPVANIDKMFIVIAPIPKPDLYLVDKLLIFCALSDIQPILCVNKSDLDFKFCENMEKIYKNLAKVLIFSTFNESVEKIKKEINGICVLAGQSAVGKSSIINALKKQEVAIVGDFCKKIERGKQTTRTVSLFEFGKGQFLADTAGFSKLDEYLLDLEEDEVKKYFFEFIEHSNQCKYKSCNHLSEKDCGVTSAVKAGKIHKSRYENYLKLYNTIKCLKRF